MPDVEDYTDDENEQQRQDPQTVLKYQKYTTRLYILLLLVSLYVLVYITLIQGNSRTVTVSNITITHFNELYLEHSDSLSCSCSNIAIPYKIFVFNRISFHSICSSIFVSKQWIEGLYLINAIDFRTTAKFQLQTQYTGKTSITSFVDDYYNPSFISVGDFHGDNHPDVAISYSEGNRIGVLFGYGNGSMKIIKKYPVKGQTLYGLIAAGDVNKD